MNHDTEKTETSSAEALVGSANAAAAQQAAEAQVQDERYLAPLEKFYRRFSSPIKEFVRKQTFGGGILFLAVIAAMILANSNAAEEYAHLLHLPIGIKISSFVFETSLQHFINDGLMTLFFLLVGLEIKREILVGELSSPRKALLPILAAVGGMLMPALIYFAFNPEGEAARGWGIPMATDIAFAVAILFLLGSRVPSAVMTFLLALAIVDDLGAVVVIGIFYTEKISFAYLLSGLGVLGVMWLMNLLGIRRLWVYALFGVAVWICFLGSGVHATIAGVLVAFVVPARPKCNPAKFVQDLSFLLEEFAALRSEDKLILASKEQTQIVEQIDKSASAVSSPLTRLEHAVQTPVNLLVIPVFAIANAGVMIASEQLDAALQNPITRGVLLGLLIGKPLGILSFTWLATKLRLGDLPEEATFSHILGVGVLGGIGFTMSIFIAELAFKANEAAIASVKIGILLASLLSGITGATLLWLISKKHTRSEIDQK
ncbi:MAG: Na+/H+ antiporter NhaA [Chloroherpetonaceae bacterium]|nr:Na+/H+ antiporter NhaA [Chloroherpetonaceae bacterium]